VENRPRDNLKVTGRELDKNDRLVRDIEAIWIRKSNNMELDECSHQLSHITFRQTCGVTFPAAEHYRSLTCTKLYCLVTEAHRCEQLTQYCYAALPRVGYEPKTCVYVGA